MALDRIRQPPVEARTHRAPVLPEPGDDRLLAFLHDEEPGGEPDQRRNDRDDHQGLARIAHVRLEPPSARGRRRSTTPATTATATEQAVELALKIAPELVKIGRCATPGALGIPRRARRRRVVGWTIRVRALVRGAVVVPAPPARVVEVVDAPRPCRWCQPAGHTITEIHAYVLHWLIANACACIVPAIEASMQCGRCMWLFALRAVRASSLRRKRQPESREPLTGVCADEQAFQPSPLPFIVVVRAQGLRR